ncbi:MAG: hypothetical protein HY812_13600 [Planctomycetes bacterium]|nr:hypothetical protein [Planctomycetota bacterium]
MNRTVLVLLAAMLAVAGALFYRWCALAPEAEPVRRLVRDPRLVVEPAPLCAAHRSEAELQDCNACHDLTAAVPSEKCLGCHEEIAERLAAASGHHGRDLGGECVACHDDHVESIIDFDRTAFNHQRALYPLRGRHAALECEDCHVGARGFRFIGIAYGDCAVCHADPHKGELSVAGSACASCHDEEEWGGRHLSFEHNRDSRYPLLGAHAALDCEACHEPPGADRPLGEARFKEIGTECAACHEDPHAAQFGATPCENCHREAGFTGGEVLFRHEDFAPFPLEGAHAAVECVECHRGQAAGDVPLYRGVSHECAACHEDPHGGQFGAGDCATCHDLASFTGRAVLFRHEDFAPFPLTGAHIATPCAGCHEPQEGAAFARFRGVPRDCAGCHEDPHQGSLSQQDCASCHVTASWSVSGDLFSHDRDTTFPLDGAHRAVDCAACHQGPVYRPAPQDCAGCHVAEAECLAGRVQVGGEWETWPPSPHAGRVACEECHDTSAPRQSAASYAARCAACHTPRYASLHLAQMALLSGLASGTDDERVRACLWAGGHDFAAAENRARALLEKR